MANANLTRKQASTMLTALGWRTNTSARLTQAIKDFQRMWNLGTALEVDGVLGPKTSAALRTSYGRRKDGKPDMSANFSAKEFACKCGGKYPGCRRIWASRPLLQLAERVRKIKGSWSPLSACRCTRHNQYVGGASASKHLSGTAMDVPSKLRLTRGEAREARAVGVGYSRSTSMVLHVDLGPSRSWVYG